MLARGLGTHYNSKIMKNHTFKNSMSWDSNALDNFFFLSENSGTMTQVNLRVLVWIICASDTL